MCVQTGRFLAFQQCHFNIMQESVSNKVFGGTVWVLLERFCCALSHFVVSMILARLLTPSDYGLIALVLIFTTIANVFVDAGFGTALIQKKDVDQQDLDTVFCLNVLMSLVLYLVLFVTAPTIARFYNTFLFSPVLRVIALVLVINSVAIVPTAILNREMKFLISFRISFLATLLSAIVGVIMAFMRMGVWALVGSAITSSLSLAVGKWCSISYRPCFAISSGSFKPLFGFGWKITLSSMLDSLFNNLYGLVIGKCYSQADLSFVNRGRQLPQMIMENINGTIGRVAFPALARKQENIVVLREAMRRMIVCSTFLIFPLLVMLAISSRRVIYLLFGSQWMPAVPYAQLACFSFALWPLHTVNLQVIQALGRSDVFLKLEIIKKALAFSILVCSIPFGVLAYMVCYAFVLGPLSVIINTWPNRKLLHYSIFSQIKDVFPATVMSCFVGIPLVLIDAIFIEESYLSMLLCLAVQLLVCIFVVIAIAVLMRFKALIYIIDVTDSYFHGELSLVRKMKKFLAHDR